MFSHLLSLPLLTPTELQEQQGSLKGLDSARENLHFHTSSTPQQGGLAAAWIAGRSHIVSPSEIVLKISEKTEKGLRFSVCKCMCAST